jgi:hypothetical protein
MNRRIKPRSGQPTFYPHLSLASAPSVPFFPASPALGPSSGVPRVPRRVVDETLAGQRPYGRSGRELPLREVVSQVT